MDASEIIAQFPYPIAVVYQMIDDETVSWPARREALSFTASQLMRTVGLTLVGQYLTQTPPEGVKPGPRKPQRVHHAPSQPAFQRLDHAAGHAE